MRSVGRQVLIAVYAVFAVAAGARSAVQLATKYDEAPVAYLLSAFAAVVYLIATIALRYRGPRATAVAWTAISIEMVGVLGVGALSVADPDLFPDQTVWSDFGSGYGFVPLVLPVIGLLWLWKQPRPAPATTTAD
ncbi:hypothetical protein [Nocardioides sp. AE5]|uniref:hypothetical protein n=1 Tax=Nocardioides sp. AE5 TaxID=2962573 RepID=UPI002881CBF0|nr:hypothetical protein [Nocardioides sp. AE5]MDT0202378.1 hypothetical protein [Nocardioides sp. AE5]